jgi:large subunit ribosomal protein L17
MRHRKKGRVLGRSPSHRLALFRNLASALFLTERDAELDDNEPGVKGRIITTLQKAKEVRPLVERCITIARTGLEAEDAAKQYATTAARNSESWKAWREGEDWKKWAHAMAPAVNARRRVVRMLGDKQATRVLFSTVAPRFVGRPGGYTRILRLSKPRLGDAGTRAILEFVGVRDRVSQRMQAPKVESGASG